MYSPKKTEESYEFKRLLQSPVQYDSIQQICWSQRQVKKAVEQYTLRIWNFTLPLETYSHKHEQIIKWLSVAIVQHLILYTKLVVAYHSKRNPRSKSKTLLTLLGKRGGTYHMRCFGKTAATLWNNHPDNSRKCKTLDAFKNVKEFFSQNDLMVYCYCETS